MLSEKPVTSTPRADDSPCLSNSGNGDFITSSAEGQYTGSTKKNCDSSNCFLHVVERLLNVQKNGHSHQVNKPEFFLRKRSSFNSSLFTTRLFDGSVSFWLHAKMSILVLCAASAGRLK